MILIYKDFAPPFTALNHEAGHGLCVAVPGGRGYLRPDRRGGGDRVYTDEIHFRIYDESWIRHECLRDRLAASPALHGRVYAGCAGMVNMDYIAATRAPAALLFDINPLQTLFWQGLTDLLAAIPGNRDFADELPRFTSGLYYRIAQLHGPGILRDMQSPAAEPDERDYGGSRRSPYRWMSYDAVAGWARHMLEPAQAPHNWLGNPEWFRHVHLLARHRALAALTLDVRDAEGCARVAETLRGAAYGAGASDPRDAAAPVFGDGVRRGAAVGLLHRSNVGYYLKWNRAEIAAETARGDVARDFSGLAAGTGTYAAARDNLRRWMDARGAHVIASDTYSGAGGWITFRPRLYAVRGLAPAAHPAIVAP